MTACGRRPWFSVKNYKELYPTGYQHGASEAPIGQSRRVVPEARSGGRRNSKYLRSWNRQGRIVNGQTADYGEWPWQVSLRQWRTGRCHAMSPTKCGYPITLQALDGLLCDERVDLLLTIKLECFIVKAIALLFSYNPSI